MLPEILPRGRRMKILMIGLKFMILPMWRKVLSSMKSFQLIQLRMKSLPVLI
uniref:Nuclear transport factor 2 family protein n=1 Tax=Rhizophora mucronata TaxID=61149 RepID=A0A2P2KQV7_RHIMU